MTKTGYTFAGWNTAANGSGMAYSAGNTFAITATTVLYAQWTPAGNYTLTYTAGPHGTISGTTPQTVASGDSGSAVTAVPDTGYHFVNWSDSSTANPRMDVNVTADISVTANFAINTYTVTYDGNGYDGGAVPMDGSNPYNYNTTVTVLGPGTLTKTGYTFAGWNTAANGSGTAYSAGNTFAITADTTLYAQWTPASSYTLTYSAGPHGSISGTTPQTVAYGSSGSAVTAVPDTGYQFVNWSDSSTANPRTDVNVTASLSVTAYFATNSPYSYTLVTFSVDMTGTPDFALGTDSVAVRGTINGWSSTYLTNDPAAANPYLFSGTITDTNDAPGGQLQYKFWNSDAGAQNAGWETTANGQNRAAILPATSGDSLVLPTAFFNDDGPPTNCVVTFQVDMSEQIALGTFNMNVDTVEVQGNFNGWSSGSTLINDPTILRTNNMSLVTSNVYVGTFTTSLSGSPGQVENYKYVIQFAGDYEQPSSVNVDGTGNRFFDLANVTNPIVYFGDASYANVVTFQVDMSAQVLAGRFDTNLDFVELRGNFNGWNGGLTLSNTPIAGNPYVYSVSDTITDAGGATNYYKFYVYGLDNLGYEHPVSTAGGNRSFLLNPNGNPQTLPLVYFGDITTNKSLVANTLVTFTVNMTGAQGTDGHVFDTNTDTVYLNRDFIYVDGISWWTWGDPPMQYALTNIAGTTNYSITVSIPAETRFNWFTNTASMALMTSWDTCKTMCGLFGRRGLMPCLRILGVCHLWSHSRRSRRISSSPIRATQ